MIQWYIFTRRAQFFSSVSMKLNILYLWTYPLTWYRVTACHLLVACLVCCLRFWGTSSDESDAWNRMKIKRHLNYFCMTSKSIIKMASADITNKFVYRLIQSTHRNVYNKPYQILYSVNTIYYVFQHVRIIIIIIHLY